MSTPAARESSLEVRAREYEAAREQLDTATDHLRAAVRLNVQRGMSEAEAARVAGVTRMTIRKWVGK